MKLLYLTIFLLFNIFSSYGQSFNEEFRGDTKTIALTENQADKQLQQFDFAALFSVTDNSIIYGFIGKSHQRIRIKFLTVKKDTSSSDTYLVHGKSMVKNMIDEFSGTIRITRIVRLTITQHGCEDESEYQGYKGQYSLFGEYVFNENNKQPHSGKFTGKFRSDYFIDKNGKIKYDNIEYCSDGYTNNQFIGTWKSYTGKLTEICNWGDYRIPESGNFDIGAGEFSPNTRDVTLGWQTIHDMWLSDHNKPTAKALRAKHIEEAQWWK